MINPKIDDILNTGRAWLSAVRDRVTQGLAGRSRPVVAIATLAGVALIGLAAATIDNTPNQTVNTAAVDAARAQAAERGNRSIRESQAPVTATSAQAVEPAPTPTETTQVATPAPAATTEAAPAPEVKKAAEWVSPMPRGQISSCFGPRWGTIHQGIDFYTDAGEPIQAVGAGTVFAAGWVYTGYGISVVIDHGNGYFTHYAHMEKTIVSVGQKVKPGDVLGYEGSTGDSTGPHLHFEVHQGMWNQTDPAPWLRERGIPVNGC